MGNGSRKLWLEHRKQDINDVKWNKIILSDRRLITWSLMSHFRYFHLYTKSNGRTLSSPYLCFTKSPKSKERNTPVDVEKPMGSYCLHANRFLYSSSQFNLIMQWKKNFICKKESHVPNYPGITRQHYITDMPSTFKNVAISIYIKHHMDTGVYLQPLGWVFFKLKQVSPPFHCFSILSACSQDKIVIKN